VIIRIAFAVIVLALAGACGTTTDRGAGQARIRDARDRLFAAISASDSKSIRAACTPDYVLIEDGPVWNVDSLVKAVEEMKEGGLRVEYAFGTDSIWVEGPVAWMTYRNQAIMSDERGADTLQWVESAVFLKRSGAWKVALLHSTGIRRKL
jgi:ketosteroid isomerase-like protein